MLWSQETYLWSWKLCVNRLKGQSCPAYANCTVRDEFMWNTLGLEGATPMEEAISFDMGG